MGFAVLGGLTSPSQLGRIESDLNPALAPYPEFKPRKASRRGLSAGKSAKTSSFPGSNDDTSEFWTCPICCADLGTNREEIGALIFQGKRVEKTLYHLGCVSQMLIHGLQQGQGRVAGPKHRPKISGQSPVTRKAVDGFLPMPAFSQRKEWANFLDWKGSGKVNAEEASEISASLLPASQRGAVEEFICKTFGVKDGDAQNHDIPLEDLEVRFLPFMEEQAAAAAKLLKPQEPDPLFTQFHCNFGPTWDTVSKRTGNINAEVLGCIVGLSANARFLSQAFGPSMWRVCRAWHMVARRLFVREACMYLENGIEVGAVVSVIKALAFITKSTDARAQKIALKLLSDFRLDVRQQGLALLASASCRGDLQALEKMYNCLSDVATLVREAALLALGRTAERDDSKAVRKVASYLSDKEASVRKAAEVALDMLSSNGNEFTIAALIQHLSSDDSAVIRLALRILAQVAPRGHHSSCTAVKKLLQNKDAVVRRAAVSSYAQLVDQNDKKSLQSFTSTLKDADVEVREAAIKSLVPVMQPYLLPSLVSCLKDSQASARLVALQTIQVVAAKGDKDIVKAVLDSLKDDDENVRIAAADLLGNFACQRDPKVVQVLAALLHGDRKGREASAQVRRALEVALGRLDPARPEDEGTPSVGFGTPESDTRSSRCCGLACLRLRR